MTHRSLSFALAGVIAGAASVSFVVAPARAMQLDEQMSLTTAEQACLSGNYQRGVDILATLYIATRKPAYIHNQARCFEQNGQYEAAIARYSEFLRQAKELPAERRAQIEANMARLEQMVARQRSGAPYYPPQATAPAQPAAAPAAPAAASAPMYYPPYPAAAMPPRSPPTDLALAQRSANRDDGVGLRIAGRIVAGVGGLVVIGAAIAGLKANSTASEVAEDAKSRQPYDAGKYDSGKHAATLSTIGFVAGPALIAGGLVMSWLGRAPQAGRTAITLAPSIAASGAHLSLAFTY
jgi:hypothetical protein